MPDGRLDREVLAALNVPIEARIRQIELNLERWRWLPDTLGDRYVLVNIPTFHLTAVDHGRVALQMRVVAGKEDSPTPIFSNEMTTVVFSPYWNVPPDIARNETIPAVMRDPGYLGRNNLEVVRAGRVLDPWGVDWSRPGKIQFRQRPGAHNALGGVKFMFPNQFDVYQALDGREAGPRCRRARPPAFRRTARAAPAHPLGQARTGPRRRP